jgi:uncharacterized repeat protein (TIGR03803 family)
MNKSGFTKAACTILLLGLTAAVAAQAQTPTTTFRTLVNFKGTNGADPGRPPIQGTDGNLYGTAGGGKYGQGVLFKLTPAGKLTTLYNFCPQTGCVDGSGPGALGLGADGNFYGGTANGGTSGYGIVFKFTGSGAPITLHDFDGTDGRSIYDRMVQLGDGNFYGTTPYGGNIGECAEGPGCGTVFQMTPSGTLTTLHDFCSLPDCADGAVLYESLALGTDGNFYGATWGGGSAADAGTVFRITPTGTLTTIYTFCADGYPFCGGPGALGPALGKHGNFYGTTAFGGAYSEGSIFKITPGGMLTTIYNFCTQIACTDGSDARSGVILGSDGNLYGTTYYGGTYNEGTVFRITPAGVLTTLHSFDGTDGYDPIGVMFQATNGVFYGQTTLGGSGGEGTIFSLDVGLRSFVETAPTSGNVGTNVIILGNKLTGATSVTFNGTSASFTVASKSEITATVPSGATTGPVKVTTPSGTLTSNVNFLVQ